MKFHVIRKPLLELRQEVKEQTFVVGVLSLIPSSKYALMLIKRQSASNQKGQPNQDWSVGVSKGASVSQTGKETK